MPDGIEGTDAASHRNPWYEYAVVATAGSVIGALLTFRVARRAGSAYLHSKFGNRKLDANLSFFSQMGNQCPRRLYSTISRGAAVNGNPGRIICRGDKTGNHST